VYVDYHDNKLLKIKSKQAYRTYFKFLP
jgi:hypothetical protein